MWHLLSVGVGILLRPRSLKGMLFISCCVAFGLMCLLCSPEVVPNDAKNEHIVLKAKSSTKPWKMSKKESADEYDL